MNKLFVWMVAATLGLCSCNTEPGAKATHVPAADNPMLQINIADLAMNTDPFCGMEITAEMIADTASYENKLYGFCAKECKVEFLKNPSQYLSAK